MTLAILTLAIDIYKTSLIDLGMVAGAIGILIIVSGF
jgi:hypothetical protein